ncbi:MAG: hypothetical protein KAW14_11770 [Candidatus Aegiribacteria sp.]|nr:hypothetical protein [Candidatus Aegiribacteria sp.]
MRLSILLVLLTLIGAIALPLKVGPALRMVITGTRNDAESENYETSLSRMLFRGGAIIMVGAMADVGLTDDLSIEASGFYAGYDPIYVTPPDTAYISINRSGYMSSFSLGVRKDLGEMFVNAGVEAQYSRESWTDPYQGNRCIIDSLSVGPTVGIGTLMDLSLCLLRFDMGLMFPDFDDIWGRIGLSLLIH